MRKIMAVVIRFLLFCAVLLVLPFVTAAQRWRPLPACPKKRDYFQAKEGGGVMLTPKLLRGISLTTLATLFLLFSSLLMGNAFAASISINPTQGPAGTQVTVIGSEWPRGDLIDFCWDFNCQSTDTSVKADGNGTFTGTITVPQNAPIGYTYIDAGDQAAFITAQAPFTITGGGALADLSPTAILYNSADLVPGKTVFFDSGVQNSGSQGTGVFNVRWFVDGVSVGYGSHAGVPANSTVLNGNSQYSWLATSGTHTIKFVVDSDNHVQESNESNNDASATVTVATGAYKIPVLVLAYYPDKNNDGLLDAEIVGGESGGAPVNQMKMKVADMTASLIEVLTYGSIYHGYKDSTAKSSLNYSILEDKSFDEAIPVSTQFPPSADHIKILNDLNICDYVENKGVKEVWIWMYHSNVVVPIESNMSGPYGDISNSNQQDDLPHCRSTYTVYNYNYGRGVSEATEDHMHQIEAVFNYVDKRNVTPADQWSSLLFWGKFVGSDASHKIIKPGCGWAHYPPNGTSDYDWKNSTYVTSDCEDWKPDRSGQVQSFNCDKWNCDSLAFFKWWMQNVPGYGNDLYDNGRKLKNWWDFIGDFDAAMAKGKSLTVEVGS